MARAKKGVVEAAIIAEDEPSPAVSSEGYVQNEIVRKLDPELLPHVVEVTLFQKQLNSLGVPVGVKPCYFEGPDGKKVHRLTSWGDLTTEQLASLYGGGEFKAACYNAKGLALKWVPVDLPGAESPPEASPSSNGEQSPRMQAVPSAAGLVVDISPFLHPAAVPVHLYAQQMLVGERERYAKSLAWMDVMNQRVTEACKLAIDMATASQTAVSEAMQTIRTLEADRQKEGGKDKKSALKLMWKLVKSERKDRGSLETKFETMRKELEEAAKKAAPKERDVILKYLAVGKELMKDLPTTYREIQAISNAHTEGTAEQAADVAHKAYLEEKGRARAKLDAEREAKQTAQAIEGSAERLDPTAQPAQAQPEPAPTQAPAHGAELAPDVAAQEPAPVEQAPTGDAPP